MLHVLKTLALVSEIQQKRDMRVRHQS